MIIVSLSTCNSSGSSFLAFISFTGSLVICLACGSKRYVAHFHHSIFFHRIKITEHTLGNAQDQCSRQKVFIRHFIIFQWTFWLIILLCRIKQELLQHFFLYFELLLYLMILFRLRVFSNFRLIPSSLSISIISSFWMNYAILANWSFWLSVYLAIKTSFTLRVLADAFFYIQILAWTFPYVRYFICDSSSKSVSCA